jgi:hypothetical protein
MLPPSALVVVLVLAVVRALVEAAAAGAVVRDHNNHHSKAHPSLPEHFVVTEPVVEVVLSMHHNHQTLHLNQSSFGRRGPILLFFVDVVVLNKHHLYSQLS